MSTSGGVGFQVEQYSAVKRAEALAQATAWVKLRGTKPVKYSRHRRPRVV